LSGVVHPRLGQPLDYRNWADSHLCARVTVGTMDIADSGAFSRWSYLVGQGLRGGETRLFVSRKCYVQAACFTQLSPIISCEVYLLSCVRHLLVIPCIVSLYVLGGYPGVPVVRGSCLSLVSVRSPCHEKVLSSCQVCSPVMFPRMAELQIDSASPSKAITM
jgi:hypothetical protein